MHRSVLAVSLSLLLYMPLAAFGQTSSPPQPITSSTSPFLEAQDGVKSPGVATLLSVLVAGGGQMYADKTGKGLALLGISMGSLVGGIALSTASCSVYYGCSVNLTPFYIGGAISLGTWIYSMATAGGDARDHNALLGLRAERPVEPIVQVAGNGRTNIGVRVALGH